MSGTTTSTSTDPATSSPATVTPTLTTAGGATSSEPGFWDYLWAGPEAAIQAAVMDTTQTPAVPKEGYSLLGPVTYAGVTYVAVRTPDSTLTLPLNCQWVDPASAAAIVGVWAAGSAPITPVILAPKPTQMTTLDFQKRFTDAEWNGILTASLANVALLSWVLKAAAASAVDLTDPVLAQGVQAMVAANLLTQDRATAILTP